jgi:mannose-6-phosphate isomerase-like protein (cupin superfamily)
MLLKSYHWIQQPSGEMVSFEARPTTGASRSGLGTMDHPMSLPSGSPPRPIIAGPDTPISATGASLVVHEWTESGPSYLHVHRSDDEAWHVLEGSLRFKFADREVDACAGTTVFVPAGLPHTYWATEPSRYLIVLTPRLDRLIARLQSLSDRSEIPSTLAEFDTVIIEQGSPH